MEILLILSALLSAVTGVIPGIRAPEARSAHAVTARAETPCPERLVRAVRMEVPEAAEARRIAAIFAPPSLDIRTAIPLYADRLIE